MFVLNKICKIHFESSKILQTNFVKYLGFCLNNKIDWEKHVQWKVKQIRTIITKCSWTYEIKIWRTAAKSNVKKIESPQFIVLRTTLNARSNLRNDDIGKIVKISTVGGEMIKHSKANHYGIKIHTSELARNCCSGFSRKFKRKFLSANLHLIFHTAFYRHSTLSKLPLLNN